MVDAKTYTIRRKILTLLGAKFHVYDDAGRVIGFSKQKAFKLKEDIRVYTDESMADERVIIKARSMLDFAAAYDVIDAATGKRLGVLKRQGLKSFLRDAWVVYDADERHVANLEEDSMALALVRRFLTNLVPQHFALKDHAGAVLAEFSTHFNPFVHKMTVRIAESSPLDPAVPLAVGLLLVAIEGRQDD